MTHMEPTHSKIFPCGSDGKATAYNAGDLGSIPGLGRPPEEGNGYPLQYSGLENSMDFIVHGFAKCYQVQSSCCTLDPQIFFILYNYFKISL